MLKHLILVAAAFILTGKSSAELLVFEDPTRELSPTEALAEFVAGKFRSTPMDRSLGYRKHDVWLYLSIDPAIERDACCLEVKYPHGDVVGYPVHNGALIGDDVGTTFSEFIRWRKIVLDFKDKLKHADGVLVRIHTQTAVVPSFQIHTQSSLMREIVRDSWVIASFYGAMLAVAFVAFAAAWLLRESLALRFGVYLLSYVLLQATMNNIAGIIAPSIASSMLRLVPILAGVSLMTFTLMIKSLVSNDDQRSLIYIQWVLRFSILFSLALIFLPQKLAVTTAYVQSILCFVSLGYALQVSSASHIIKLLYWGSWFPYFGGIVLSFGKTFGFLGNNLLTNYSMQFGSAVQVLSIGIIAGLRLRSIAVERAAAFEELHLRETEVKLYRAVAQTTQMLAHDVRKPFGLIRMFSSIIEKCSPEEVATKTRWLLPNLERNIRSVDSLIDDVISAGSEHTLSPIPTSLDELIKECVEDVRGSNIESKAQFVFQFNHDTTIPVIIDRVKISRAFKNILNNAVEAIGNEGIVTVLTSNYDGGLKIVFRNDGPGMSDADAASIFDPFVTIGKRGGTGLGLAIAQRFIHAHQGCISCKSGTERGVDFIISLPIQALTRHHASDKMGAERS